MRYILTITITILMLLILSSCNNDNQNVFTGIITEAITSNKIANAEIIIEAKQTSTSYSSNSYKEIGRTSTNENGEYSIETEAIMAIDYRVTVITDNYHSVTKTYIPQDIIGEYNLSFVLCRESFLKIHFKDNSPFNNEDNLTFKINNENENCQACCQTNFINLEGPNIDTIYSCQTTGYNTLELYAIITKNNTSNIETQDIYCTPNDTVEIDFFY